MPELPASSRIVRAAQSQRDLLGGFRDAAILDMATFLQQNHPVIVMQEQGWDDRIAAVMVPRPRPASTIIGVNASHALGKRNFSLAHELGHLLLHARLPRGPRAAQAQRVLEREADLFALELLLPERLLRGWWEAYRFRRPGPLARRLCLSRVVVEWRLQEYGMLPTAAGRPPA